MKETSYSKRLKQYLPVFLLTDFVFIFLIYVVADELIIYLSSFIIIFTFLSIVFIFYREYSFQRQIKKKFLDFLEDPSFESRDKLVENLGTDWKKIVYQLYKDISDKNQEIDQMELALNSYREFIEEWTHEIKTPLLISNLLLENHNNDLSPDLKDRLRYINTSFETSIDKILFYARSDADHVDYKIKAINIRKILDTVIEKYYPLIGEKGVIIRDKAEDFIAFSDENVLVFIISQIMDNALKYTEDMIEIETIESDKYNHIEIIDNGDKVDDQDAPFIFEKGFTGEISYKQKPTGMGLYLVKKYADDLGLKVEISSNEKEHFGIRISFPKIK
ncbi:MAG: HAMP domain-containing sensor histidine kinase [Peptoniphilaceae bacterium]|nr:HAMP domain-containing sensor histidine kinase [Peptoniphilaceae bacterium]MDY6019749.1 HAMP domain-containing sensor histidine kinase [Anaerococcus sp.]